MCTWHNKGWKRGIEGQITFTAPQRRTFPQRLPAENSHGNAVGHHTELPPPPRARARSEMVQRINLGPNVPAKPVLSFFTHRRDQKRIC